MAITKPIITENDYVELMLSVGTWPTGTRGTAVSDHGASKLVEISDDNGQMLDLVEVPEAHLKLISSHPADPPDHLAR
jgi:hypothetical protein